MTNVQGQPTARNTPEANAYSSEVRAAWSEFLRTLPSQARLLDVGTGNHVPALIAAELAAQERRGWQIDVIDTSRATSRQDSVARHVALERIAFHTGATPTQLPFEAAEFDALCGHHVLEFIDPKPALAEFRRVLRPGGDAQFLLHHADSPFLQSARFSLREADLVFAKTKAFRRVHRLVTMREVVPQATQRANDEVRLAIRTLKRGLEVARQHRGGRVLTVALESIRSLLAARRDARPELAGLVVDRAEEELRASVRRLGELAGHALTEAGMQRLAGIAATAGFTRIEHVVLRRAGGEVSAWQLLLHRA